MRQVIELTALCVLMFVLGISAGFQWVRNEEIPKQQTAVHQIGGALVSATATADACICRMPETPIELLPNSGVVFPDGMHVMCLGPKPIDGVGYRSMSPWVKRGTILESTSEGILGQTPIQSVIQP